LKAETKEEADDWIWELRRWAEWARGRELAPNAREQQEKEERERKEKEEQDKAAASYRSRSGAPICSSLTNSTTRTRTRTRHRTRTSAHLYFFTSASFPAEWFPKLTDALLGKSEVSPIESWPCVGLRALFTVI
jgi:hypothetical protein